VRVVLDTNTVVSGLLWDNQPRAIIDAAIEQRIRLFTCTGLIEELAGILPREKFTRRLAEKQLSIPLLIERYSALADIIEPAILSGPVSPDPDDDLALATALAAQADLIVSRDKHLRNLKSSTPPTPSTGLTRTRRNNRAVVVGEALLDQLPAISSLSIICCQFFRSPQHWRRRGGELLPSHFVEMGRWSAGRDPLQISMPPENASGRFVNVDS